MTPHAKLFARVTESSLTSAPKMSQLAFFYLLAIADRKGQVIGTDDRIAARICFELPDFTAAIGVLTSPDEQSSSKAHEGRRLVATEEPRGYRIVNYRAYQGSKPSEADPEHCPTHEFSLAISAIFKRKPTTPWDEKEITAYKKLFKAGVFDLEGLQLVHRFYEYERAKGEDAAGQVLGYHRRQLATFLNNYQGEVDKARIWAARFPKTAAKPLRAEKAPELPLSEPPGFMDWFRATYTKAPETTRFQDIPEDIRRLYQTKP